MNSVSMISSDTRARIEIMTIYALKGMSNANNAVSTSIYSALISPQRYCSMYALMMLKTKFAPKNACSKFEVPVVIS